MIETIIRITGEELSGKYVKKVIALAHEMLAKPIELLDGVEQVLQTLHPDYRIAVATKGDLLDQERKIKNSGLADYFHHIEIMSEKHENDYSKLIKRLDVQPDEFLMLGNSLKSDILPVLALGAHAIHIPYYVTWEFERVEQDVSHLNFRTLNSIREVLPMLQMS
jgi:putative hydrolase of the HAD superfamily